CSFWFAFASPLMDNSTDPEQKQHLHFPRSRSITTMKAERLEIPRDSSLQRGTGAVRCLPVFMLILFYTEETNGNSEWKLREHMLESQ
ncbi:hypothetical protein XENOCAPTIV_025256, partial [Xenoophorus captivus]